MTAITGQPIAEKARDLLEPVLVRDGFELVEVEWLRLGGRWTLRVFIDRPGGVQIDDCQAVSRTIEPILDVEDFIEPAYDLEVSSPGLDRPLWTLADCARWKGSRVTMRLERKLEGTAKLKGILEDVREDSLTVLDEDRKRRYTVRFGDVRRARLVPEL